MPRVDFLKADGKFRIGNQGSRALYKDEALYLNHCAFQTSQITSVLITKKYACALP